MTHLEDEQMKHHDTARLDACSVVYIETCLWVIGPRLKSISCFLLDSVTIITNILHSQGSSVDTAPTETQIPCIKCYLASNI